MTSVLSSVHMLDFSYADEMADDHSQCDPAPAPINDLAPAFEEYKGLPSLDILKDSAQANMERYNAEEAARHFVNSSTLQVPSSLTAVYNDLVASKILDTTSAAENALQYLRSHLPSSVVVEQGSSLDEHITFLNYNVLGQWLASSNALTRSDFADDDSEHSWDSWANNTVATNASDFCGSPSTDNVKPPSVRQLLYDELFLISSTKTSIDSLISEFDATMTIPSGAEHQTRAAAVRRTAPRQFVKICPHNESRECHALGRIECRDKLHLERVIVPTTDESLGDCNYLDTCFKGRGCRYVHYRVQLPANRTMLINSSVSEKLQAPQWIQCNLQQIDMTKMGNDYGVIIADPPWDIHMSPSKLMGNALRDEDIANLAVENLQSEGIIFLWVTGRALDAGRACLRKWGYQHTEELIWLKINQLGRTIGTGRTGHWLNHTKEHLLVGVKGNPKFLKRQLDVDTLVSISQGNSKKPTEIYSIVERLVGSSTRKIELFGRENNLQPGWLTLGCELNGTQLNDPLLKFRWARACKTER